MRAGGEVHLLHRLLGYVVALNRNDRGELMKRLAAKINDRSPARWISLDEAERRLVL